VRNRRSWWNDQSPQFWWLAAVEEIDKKRMNVNRSLFRGRLVRLAAPREEDAEAFSRWSEDAEYLRALDTDYARPLSPKEFAEKYAPGHTASNAVEFRLRTLAEDRLIGFVALHSIEWNNQAAMLAIGIGDEDHRGKGFGTDALRLILSYGFLELNLYRVGLDVIATNLRAIRAYENVGFKREGAMRGAVLRDGQRSDRIMMGILREEWQDDITDKYQSGEEVP
jgi:RimJ/RimL family protein N-acetyltransferase